MSVTLSECRSKIRMEMQECSRSLCFAIRLSWYLEGIQFVEDEKKKGSMLYLREVGAAQSEPYDRRTSFPTFATLLWSCS